VVIRRETGERKCSHSASIETEHTMHDGTTVIEFNRSGTVRPYDLPPELGAAFQRGG